MDKQILKFDINEIHEANESLGFPTGWEYFEDELKTYTTEDKKILLEELRNNELV